MGHIENKNASINYTTTNIIRIKLYLNKGYN